MRILLLTQYFPPEIGAPQNRLYELAVRLKNKGASITVVTALPNYPEMEIYPEYKGLRSVKEEMDGLQIHRSWIYVKKSKSIAARLLTYFSFVFTSFFTGIFRAGKADIIICESPPLFLGITGWFLKKIKGAKLVFNVSDLWPESAEKLGLVTNKFFLKCATLLEEFMYRHSELVSGQTQGIVRNISTRFPKVKTHWLPNGVDFDFFKAEKESDGWREENSFSERHFLLLYAGILGHAQGLEVILKAAERFRKNELIRFIIVGSGPEKEKLISMKNQLGLDHVHFYDSVSKAEMPAIISAANAAIIPLKRLELFKGAIPSKIFETLAMKKPILLGVEGEAKELFIEQASAGLAFTPEDDGDLAKKIMKLYNSRETISGLGENGYNFVRENFSRDKTAEEFWKQLQMLIGET
ncbi:MAG TPA: glycosyltransferase family 4 protein [Bacteroidia bacterium]|nr:glycosyltransferase family 4 protein [Bacteroidia bacterium]